MSNVNVTLTDDSDPKPPRTFPCPLCATQLDVRRTFRDKPYCVCQSCGVQIFFRGKKGISRLRKLLDEHKRLIGGATTPAVALFNQLEQLRAQKHELEQRRPFIFSDSDLENAIAAIARDIDRLQAILADLSGASKS
jgi:uncharacterized small protein (DUF1192 family)/DNA-directed RNA polymerase subunit RPC12/RpoP